MHGMGRRREARVEHNERGKEEVKVQLGHVQEPVFVNFPRRLESGESQPRQEV